MTVLFRIDNYVVYKIKDTYGNCPINRYEKNNNIKLEVSKLPFISKGSKLADNIFLAYYNIGAIKIEDIFGKSMITYP